MKLLHIGVLSLLLSTVAMAADAKKGTDASDWRRHVQATAPWLKSAPTIDGVVDKAEWSGASALGPMAQLADGVSDGLARNTYIGYDAENLYIAFEIERPADVREPAMPDKAGRIDNWRAGDAVEFMIDVGRTQKTYKGFVLFANGAYGEGVGNPGMDRHWNCDWKQAATLTDKGWSGEASIPFKSLRSEGTPKAGETWGFDIVDNQRTPYEQVSTWAFRGPSWHKFSNFGVLRFGEAQAGPAVRLLRVGEAGQSNAEVLLEVVNTGDKAASIQVDVQLLRRKDGPAGGAKSYYDHVESGGDDAYNAGATDFEKTTELGALIEEGIHFHDPVEGGRVEQTLEIPAGERRTVGVMKPIQFGEFLTFYNFRGAKDEILFAGERVFKVEPPLALTVEPYWLHAQVVEVTADLRKVSVPEGSTLSVQIGDRPAVSTAVKSGGRSAKVTLPVGDLAVGFHDVKATVTDASGKAVAANASPIEKPAPPVWHNTDLGKMEVSEPWTPLVVSDKGKVSMWGRSYDLGSVFPASIVSQEKELLGGPMRLEVVSKGETLAWQEVSLTEKQRHRGKVVYDVKLSNAKVSIAGTMWVEFDGLVWYDLVMTPIGKPAIDSMRFAIDLKAEHAELLSKHSYLQDPVLSAKAVKPAKEGPSGVLAETWMPFSPYVWFGCERGGVAFVAEAPVDWQISRPTEVMQVYPPAEGGPARMRITMIDAPTTLEKPMRLQFGVQASPIRPFPEESVAHVDQIGGPSTDPAYYKNVADFGGRTVAYHGGWKGDKQREWSGWPGHPSDPERRAAMKAGIAEAHKNGLTVSIYTGWGVAVASDEWKYFRHEMTRRPLENSGFGTYRQSAGLSGAYIDYMAYTHAELMKAYDNDGVFWDSASNLMQDENVHIGNGWIDDQGRTRPKFAVLGTRELFRRIYNLSHGGIKKKGLCMNFGGSVWAINVYADIFHRGEGTPMHVSKLIDAWKPMEDFRSGYGSRNFGIPYLAMNKNFKRLPMTVNRHLTVTLLHGALTKGLGNVARDPKRSLYGDDHQPMGYIWKARNWLPFDGTTQWHAYYQDGKQYVSLSPDTLLSSLFVSGDGKRALLVVSNLHDAAVKEAQVSIDLAKLGMTNVEAEDAILSQPVEIKGGAMTLAVDAERYRLIKLWGK